MENNDLWALSVMRALSFRPNLILCSAKVGGRLKNVFRTSGVEVVDALRYEHLAEVQQGFGGRILRGVNRFTFCKDDLASCCRGSIYCGRGDATVTLQCRASDLSRESTRIFLVSFISFLLLYFQVSREQGGCAGNGNLGVGEIVLTT